MATARISLRVLPRSNRECLERDSSDHFVLRVRAAPVDGNANEAVVRRVAEVLGVRQNQVRIVHGVKSRNKVLEIEGMDTEEASRRLKEHAVVRRSDRGEETPA